jgi:hypothetical protein
VAVVVVQPEKMALDYLVWRPGNMLTVTAVQGIMVQVEQVVQQPDKMALLMI